MKKSNQLLALSVLSAILLIVAASCKKEKCQDHNNPDCENHNPCYGKTTANATFHFYVSFDLDDYKEYFFKTDTIERRFNSGVPRRIYFKVDDKSVDSCWWKIGNDPRVFREKEFFLDFDGSSEYNLSVQLIVEKNGIQNCYPGYPERDTFIRSLQFIEAGTLDIKGTYFGYLDDNPEDTVTFSINLELQQYEMLVGRTRIFSSKEWELLYIENGWKEFRIQSLSPSTHVPSFTGIGKLERDILEIDFRSKFVQDDYKQRDRKFKGIRQ